MGELYSIKWGDSEFVKFSADSDIKAKLLAKNITREIGISVYSVFCGDKIIFNTLDKLDGSDKLDDIVDVPLTVPGLAGTILKSKIASLIPYNEGDASTANDIAKEQAWATSVRKPIINRK